LVRVAVAFHGTIPVLMVLGQLLFDSKSSFIFSSSLDLYKDVGKPELFGELDLVCIEDGDFVIGEIKQSASLFQPEDFEKMKSVAKLIRPDKIIFSSMDEKLDQRIKVQIEQLGKDLAELEIKIEWLQLPYWVFKAHPVR
jgi:hypothetical protein